jgi:hypothetical protein
MSPFNPLPLFHIGIPSIPTRDEILGLDGKASITFQGLRPVLPAYGLMPGFEAVIAWLDNQNRQAYWNSKKAAKDSHFLISLPGGPALYDEPNQPYNASRFGPLDWTNGNTSIDNRLTSLIKDTLVNFNKGFLFLDGDGPNNSAIAMKQLDLLRANDEYNTLLYKYCILMPGWDSVFYGWLLEDIVAFGKKFRQYWPYGYFGLEHNIGHIPLGEGGSDFKPGGRLQDFDIIVSEYDRNLHEDACWQINGRLTKNYKRPFDQPSTDDPNPPYYLSEPSPRGPFAHCAFEFGEYEDVREDPANIEALKIVTDNRAYQKSMGCLFTG